MKYSLRTHGYIIDGIAVGPFIIRAPRNPNENCAGPTAHNDESAEILIRVIERWPEMESSSNQSFQNENRQIIDIWPYVRYYVAHAHRVDACAQRKATAVRARSMFWFHRTIFTPKNTVWNIPSLCIDLGSLCHLRGMCAVRPGAPPGRADSVLATLKKQSITNERACVALRRHRRLSGGTVTDRVLDGTHMHIDTQHAGTHVRPTDRARTPHRRTPGVAWW